MKDPTGINKEIVKLDHNEIYAIEKERERQC